MIYCIKSNKIIFSQYGENIWGVSTQVHDIFKYCPKKKCCHKKYKKILINETTLKNKLLDSFKIKVFNKYYLVKNFVIKNDIIIFYITEKPDVKLYIPYFYTSIFIINEFCIVPRNANNNIPITTKIPIDNLATGAGYSMPIKIGGQSLLLLLDTGSSTLSTPEKGIITPNDSNFNTLNEVYNSSNATKTNEIQYITYGTGSLGGPAVIDEVSIKESEYENLFDLKFCAGIYAPSYQSPLCNGGILGLAYPYLNSGQVYQASKTPIENYNEIINYKFCACFNCSGINPPTNISNFWNNLLVLNSYTTFLEQIGNIYDKYAQRFGLYCTRTYRNNKDISENIGQIILFGGEEYNIYYFGNLIEIPLQKLGSTTWNIPNYQFYQVNLVNVIFTLGSEKLVISMPQLNPDNFPQPNIIDSGTSELQIVVNDNDIDKIKTFFEKIPFVKSNGFETILSSNEIYSTNITNIKLEEWPIISFEFNAGNQNHIFNVSPKNYFQNYYIDNTSTSLALTIQSLSQSQNTNANCIIGLPFICENYCVFDYGNNLIKIALRK